MASSSASDDYKSEINVTPLVDVMLVLLIVMMVTASFAVSRAMEVNLPTASSGSSQSAPLNLVVEKSGRLLLDAHPLTLPELAAAIEQRRTGQPQDLSAVIAADADTAHRNVVRVMDQLKKLGISQVAIGVMEPQG